jgi:DNA-binding transcriptional regulator YiaG
MRIKDAHQLWVSYEQRHRLLDARAHYLAHPHPDPLAQAALLESVDHMRSAIEAEIAEYEAARDGTGRELEADGLRSIPDVLIRARIAAGLSQRQLAERLGTSEEVVRRDEEGGYADASLGHLVRVAEALGLRVVATASFVGSHAEGAAQS